MENRESTLGWYSVRYRGRFEIDPERSQQGSFDHTNFSTATVFLGEADFTCDNLAPTSACELQDGCFIGIREGRRSTEDPTTIIFTDTSGACEVVNHLPPDYYECTGTNDPRLGDSGDAVGDSDGSVGHSDESMSMIASDGSIEDSADAGPPPMDSDGMVGVDGDGHSHSHDARMYDVLASSDPVLDAEMLEEEQSATGTADANLTQCGNSVLEMGEACDDGLSESETPNCAYGVMSCVVCSAQCETVDGRAMYCGDGEVQPVHETCDPPNTNAMCENGTCYICDESCMRQIDTNGDGVWDGIDNCTDIPNTDQNDRNGNGIGDVCDPCGNGVHDLYEPCDPTAAGGIRWVCDESCGFFEQMQPNSSDAVVVGGLVFTVNYMVESRQTTGRQNASNATQRERADLDLWILHPAQDVQPQPLRDGDDWILSTAYDSIPSWAEGSSVVDQAEQLTWRLTNMDALCLTPPGRLLIGVNASEIEAGRVFASAELKALGDVSVPATTLMDVSFQVSTTSQFQVIALLDLCDRDSLVGTNMRLTYFENASVTFDPGP